MRRWIAGLGLGMFLLVASARSAQAQLLEWAQQADVVCLAHVAAVEPAPGVVTAPWGQVPMQTMKVELEVREAIKGAPETPLRLAWVRIDFSKFAGGLSGNWPNYDFVAGHDYLLFLQRSADGYYRLVNAGGAGSVVESGAVAFKKDDKDAIVPMALLPILLEIAEAPSAGQLRALDLLGDYRGVMWDEMPDWAGENAVSALSPTERAALKKKIVDEVWPQLVKLRASPGSEVRRAALYSATSLQNIAMIPDWVAQIENGDKDEVIIASNNLGEYQVRAAVPALTELLKHPNPLVRTGAARSLRFIHDRSSLPALLAAVDNSDRATLYEIIWALYNITGEMPPSSVKTFPAREAEYRAFWKNWKP